MDSPPAGVEGPKPEGGLLLFLMGIGLADHEMEFRSILQVISQDVEAPALYEITIATVALLMSVGGVRWPAVMKVTSALSTLSEEELLDSSVAVVNGGYLYLPTSDGVHIYSLTTLDRLTPDNAPTPLVSSIYSTQGIWETAQKILR